MEDFDSFLVLFVSHNCGKPMRAGLLRRLFVKYFDHCPSSISLYLFIGGRQWAKDRRHGLSGEHRISWDGCSMLLVHEETVGDDAP